MNSKLTQRPTFVYTLRQSRTEESSLLCSINYGCSLVQAEAEAGPGGHWLHSAWVSARIAQEVNVPDIL